MKSLFEHSYNDLSDEIFEKIIEEKSFFVERIISFGQKTPENLWLTQNRAELVFLLKGWAKIQFKNKSEILYMKPGNYILIEPNEEHRVFETAPYEETIWLAIHFDKS
jgi:cupin 2 domain-containing protein